MRRYLDTSLLVAALVRETGTEAAKAFLSAARDDALLVSRWALTEFSSALALKVRSGTLAEAERGEVLAMFRRFTVARLAAVEIEPPDFDSAARFCDEPGATVRAGDALHLAACKRMGARLVTFDAGMAAAAGRYGLACDLLTSRT